MKRFSGKSKTSNRASWTEAVKWIVLCELVGILGALFTTSEISTWYRTLVKPSFSPPNWLFGPAWTTLYALMGIAAWRIWRLGQSKHTVKTNLAIFIVHLVFNGLWSVLFFGLHNIFAALLNIIVIWIFIIILMLRFAKLDKLSAYLLVPYFAWVSFATLLNLNIWLLNR